MRRRYDAALMAVIKERPEHSFGYKAAEMAEGIAYECAVDTTKP